MTHDPLCDFKDNGEWADICDQCALIAAVREDEKWKADLAITFWEQHASGSYQRALRDAVEAVKVSLSADIELVERSQVIADIEALGEER